MLRPLLPLFATAAFFLFTPQLLFAQKLTELPGQIAGQVLSPEDEPVADAPVILYWRTTHARTRTDEAGNFRLNFDHEQVRQDVGDDWSRMAVVSSVPNLGPAWQTLANVPRDRPLTLKLVKDVPVTGRILDQQGRPIEGATVTVLNLHRDANENLDGFLRASRDQPGRLWLHERDKMIFVSPEAIMTLRDAKKPGRPTVTTNADGRFELQGFGRERSLFCSVGGPNITSDTIYILTRTEIDARWNRGKLSRETQQMIRSGTPLRAVYPAKFHYLGSPAATIHGVLSDAETGKPVEGMNVMANIRGTTTFGNAVSDAEGRYQITGLSMEGQLRLSVLNPGDQPYLDARLVRRLDATNAVKPIDFQLDKGVLVTGKVVDGVSGQIVEGNVGYLASPTNEGLKQLNNAYDTFNTMSPDESGNYRLIVPPGPGVITFQARNRSQFDHARPEDFGFRLSQNGVYQMFPSVNRGYVRAEEFHFLKRIDLAPEIRQATVDIELGRGPVIQVAVVTDDETPLDKLEVRGLTRGSFSRLAIPKFELLGMQPDEKRTVFVRNDEQTHAGIFEFTMPADSSPEPQTITLAATAVVSGRLVTTDDRPLSKWRVAAMSSGAEKTIEARLTSNNRSQANETSAIYQFAESTTDADGYFRLTGIPSGIEVELLTAKEQSSPRAIPKVFKTLSLRPRQNRDLEQVRLKQQ